MVVGDRRRDALTHVIDALKRFYYSEPDVYVSGDICLFYDPDRPECILRPEVFVCFDVPNHDRSCFRIWEEVTPVLVIEFDVPGTAHDQRIRRDLYRDIGVREYFHYQPGLQTISGFFLDKGIVMKHLPEFDHPALQSILMDLVLVADPKGLRIHDAWREGYIPTPEEAERTQFTLGDRLALTQASLTRAWQQRDKERMLREAAEQRAERERKRRKRAEAALRALKSQAPGFRSR